MSAKSLGAALAAAVLLLAPAAEAETGRIVIDNVRVLSEDGAEFSSPRRVVVENGRIAAVTAPGRGPRQAGGRVVDGDGRYLIPGLSDMHVHVVGAPDRERLFKLFIANGVTSVRDMNGVAPIAEANALKREIEAGRMLGPRFWYPGPILDGKGRAPAALGPNVREVATPDEARAAVRSLKSEGADFVKPYYRLAPDVYAAIVDEARRQNLPVAGHVPFRVSAVEASSLGQRSIEHLTGVVEYSSDAWAEMSAFLNARADMLNGTAPPTPDAVQELFRLRRAATDTWNEARAEEVVAAFKHNETWQTPTLVSNRLTLFVHRDPSYRSDPRLALYATSGQREAWDKAQYAGAYGGPAANFDLRWEEVNRTVRMLADAAVPILAGTDLGAEYIYAGFSLHDELGLLVEAGLTPAAALRAATIEPAKFLGLEDSGRIAKGARADLVLLRDDPLADIEATRTIEAVVVNGRLLDRPALDRLLDEGKAASLAE